MRSLRTGWTPSFGRKRLEGSNWLPGPTLNGHLPYSLRFAGRQITIARLLAATTRQQKGRQTEARRPRLKTRLSQVGNDVPIRFFGKSLQRDNAQIALGAEG